MKARTKNQITCLNCPRGSNGVFCRLSAKELSTIDQSRTSNAYRRGQVVFYEGNASLGAYCVFSGQVKLYKLGAEGAARVVRLAGPGELLGHESLLSGEPYSVTAEVIADSTLCFIDKNTLLELMEQSPALALEVARRLSRNLLRAEANLQDMTQKSAEARMASVLLDLDEAYQSLGIQKPRQMRLPRQMLSEMVGVTRETAVRILTRLKQRRIISSRGQAVTLLKPESLRELADIPA